jgi:hypothetical protein
MPEMNGHPIAEERRGMPRNERAPDREAIAEQTPQDARCRAMSGHPIAE